MSLSYRYVGPDGNITEIYNDSRRYERNYLLSPPSHSEVADFEYPVTISCSGHGIWEEGARFRLIRCDRFAIELITAGDMQFIQDGKEYEVRPGMVFFLRPGSITETTAGNAGYLHKRFVVLSGPKLDHMRGFFRLTDPDICTLDDPHGLTALIKRANRLLRDRPDDYQRALSVLAYEIMVLLSIAVMGRRFPPSISAVLHYMSRHIEGRATVRELSEAAGVSRSHFHRLFREHLGANPLQYFMRMKINHIAAQLRSSPQRTIGEIAREHAFEDQAYFTHVFRKIMGESPGRYRGGTKTDVGDGANLVTY